MWKRLFFSILLAAAVAWVVVDDLIAPLAKDGEIVVIPNYCGEALESIAPSESITTEVEYRYDPSVAAGEVISQEPQANSRRKRADGEKAVVVHLVVSLGAQTVELPQAVGENVRVIRARLRELGCAVETVYETGVRPEGEVLWMEPPQGTVVPVGTTVRLQVSAGTHTESVRVPDFCGLTRSDALVRLWMAGLSLGTAEEIESDRECGRVVEQSHRAGTLVPMWTKITLYISREAEE